MDEAALEEHLNARAGHHDAKLDVTSDGGWAARFVRDDGTVVLTADGADREAALRALYELDELEDLAGG
jgi:hypothetical protein